MIMKIRRSQKSGACFPLTEGRNDLPKADLGPILPRSQNDKFDTPGPAGGVKKMKKRPSVIPMALAGITAAAVYFGAFCNVASAQNTSTTKVSANPPPAAGASQAPALPYGVGEVVKMYQGGIHEDVIVNYINSTALPYHLNADGIIYLQTLGMPQEITKSIILRDGQLHQQAMQRYSQPQPMPGPMPAPNAGAPDQPPVQVVTPTTPAPAVTEIGGSDYPYYDSYDYGYPYYGYGYPYYGYGWPYYGGWYVGWPLVGGWGWGYGGFRGGYGGFRGGYGGFRGGYGFHGGGGFRGGGGFHGGFGGGHGGGGGAGHGGGHGGGHR